MEGLEERREERLCVEVVGANRQRGTTVVGPSETCYPCQYKYRSIILLTL